MRLFALLSLVAATLGAQSEFKEFSVRPTTTEAQSIRIKGNTLEGQNVSLRQLIQIAYTLPPSRVAGPEWLDKQGYDVRAIPADGEYKTLRPLLQKALASRFGLVTHMEQRQIDGYVLSRIPGTEPKLAPANSSIDSSSKSTGQISGRSATMEGLAAKLSEWMDAAVFDETGLTGHYSLSLNWDTADSKSLEAAVRNQLGLQLTPTHKQLQVLVVDHAEQLRASR